MKSFSNPKLELYRRALEPEPLAQKILKVSPVREVYQACVVREEDKRRWPHFRLRTIFDAKWTPSRRRRWVRRHSFSQHGVHLRSRDSMRDRKSTRLNSSHSLT